MSKAEEFAYSKYPKSEKGMLYDLARNSIIKGYLQAEKDIKEELSKLLDNYREELNKSIESIRKERIDILNKKVSSFKYKENEVLEFYKKDFLSLDKVLKKILKDNMISSYESVFKEINKIFDKDIDEDIKNKIIEDIDKFINKNYQKQIMDSFDIKVLVKDTILINSINESNERYLFTLNNSRLFSIE